MNGFDRFVISKISPAWALKRTRSRIAYKAWSEYEAVAPSRYRRQKKERASANVEVQKSAADLRALARNLENNLDIASGALDVLVANTVGTGIQPEPQVQLNDRSPAQDLNLRLLALFEDWIRRPEVTHEMDYYSLQRLLARSFFRDGDVFGQKLMGPVRFLDHGTILPYSLEALEADYVPLDLNEDRRNIVQGVELNAWGRPRAYHILKGHPGDAARFHTDTKRIPADRMFHLKLVKRLHQVRGISVFASALARLDDIKEIDESERVAARVAAAMAGFIKKGIPDMYVPDVGEDGLPKKREMEMVPGVIYDDLIPGEDVGTIVSNRPNNALIAFRDSQLKSASAGLGAGYSSLAKDYSGTYSSQRQELVEQYVHYRILTGYITWRFCQRVWDSFIDVVLMTGAVDIPANVDRETLHNASHSAPPMPWIDPKKEMDANAIAEEHQWKSRLALIRDRGGNPDQVNREILADQEERERLGISKPVPDPAAAAPGLEPDPANSGNDQEPAEPGAPGAPDDGTEPASAIRHLHSQR